MGHGKCTSRAEPGAGPAVLFDAVYCMEHPVRTTCLRQSRLSEGCQQSTIGQINYNNFFQLIREIRHGVLLGTLLIPIGPFFLRLGQGIHGAPASGILFLN
eukprot:scaffold187435_cov37-Tisochrysis_lutea.AAC.1